ncbi:fructose-1,6-bisphosphatase II [Hypnocyclicus thermotrophus]|uniref:Fructose-1,6-bisphosphatase n=1 Tax=Hypnocyclicus thermotrophus TaxID=1627895 RepID=A0AA46DXY0_9FUSO|nr:class II fructose-bisphosphatase [Hypnocyclicus thermotrophus]TDT69133.1 fructose-1,6-bisphosphatase II [Hypnocyclicus thermotrophus]
MKRELALEFARITEAAALAAYKWIGKGDKEGADQAAVDAMRNMLNEIEIEGEIVIGEGEIDEAPMLYIGEKVGKYEEIENISQVDIAVDPVEGTRMVAQGQANAIAVLAAGNKGSFLKAPDMYMEKLIVGPRAKGAIDLNLPLMENINNIAEKMNKKVSELKGIILYKQRHYQVIEDLQRMGVSIYALPDGDVAGSLLTAIVDSGIDFLYGIGGAPEGVVSAAALKALGGDMNARLKLRREVKGISLENDKISNFEKKRCEEMGIDITKVLTIDDMVKDDEIVFSATGITKGDLLEGIKRNGNIARTQTLLIRGKTKTIRYINSIHNLEYKDDAVKELLI